MLPKKVRIGAHWYKIVETDDTAALNGDNYGHWEAIKQQIFIKKTISPSHRAETLLHELGEVIAIAILGISEEQLKHKDWGALSEILVATLLINKIDLLKIAEERGSE